MISNHLNTPTLLWHSYSVLVYLPCCGTLMLKPRRKIYRGETYFQVQLYQKHMTFASFNILILNIKMRQSISRAVVLLRKSLVLQLPKTCRLTRSYKKNSGRLDLLNATGLSLSNMLSALNLKSGKSTQPARQKQTWLNRENLPALTQCLARKVDMDSIQDFEIQMAQKHLDNLADCMTTRSLTKSCENCKNFQLEVEGMQKIHR